FYKKNWKKVEIARWGGSQCTASDRLGQTVASKAEIAARKFYRNESVTVKEMIPLANLVRNNAPLNLTDGSESEMIWGMIYACASEDTLRAMESAGAGFGLLRESDAFKAGKTSPSKKS
ncbi:hypothetical protein, partial [Buttiauxella sp. S19-1]|uniref:hypothetical protein n=1 Tax=Buttiauxella sp. S19-1 TaxID=941430 RepID=UPI001EDA684B